MLIHGQLYLKDTGHLAAFRIDAKVFITARAAFGITRYYNSTHKIDGMDKI